MLDKVHLLVILRFNNKFLSFALAVRPSLQEILLTGPSGNVHALIRDHSWSLSNSLNK